MGEIIYNGCYKGDNRCASEKGIAYICVEVDATTDKALLVCLDVVGLAENYNGCISEDYMERYYTYMDDLETSPVGDRSSKFFLLSYEQYEKYVANEDLKDYLMYPTVSKTAKKDKKEVDEANFTWTVAHTDYWLLNDFTKKSNISVVNVETGEVSSVSNYKNYAGIRPCYWAYVGDVFEEL